MDPQQARSVQTRQRLLDAARERIEDDGIDALTLAAVAAGAGVAVGTVYNRFRDKRHLIGEVIREWTGEVTASFAERRDAASAPEGMRDPFGALVVLFSENRRFIRQIIIHAPLDTNIAASVEPWLAGEQQRLTADVIKQGTATDRRAKLVSTIMLSTLERAAVADIPDADWAELQDELPKMAARLLN